MYRSSVRRKNIILVILMVILVGMTIGYSALSSYLKINGTSNITSDFKVVFTDIQEGTMNSATTVSKSYEGTSATFQVKLDKPGSNAEYVVTVQNQGKLDAYLQSIEGIDEANNKAPTYITFSVKDLSINEKLGVNQTKTFKVIVSYNMAATEIPTESKQLTLTLNYSQDTGETLPDIVGAFEEPVIKDGLIPVMYDAEGNTVKADTNGYWYNYDAKEWANAVAVTQESRTTYQSAEAGTPIEEEDVLAYYVWIPRYRYKLWNVDGVSNEQEIEIEFETTTTAKTVGTVNGEWLTHPAFTFGDEEIPGFWFGKFEMTGTGEAPTIKPNLASLTNQNISTAFNTIQSMSSDTYGLSQYDSHMMKNMEFGAVAYLTNSKYGRCTNDICEEIWVNNVNTGTGEEDNGVQWGPSITGCSGNEVSAEVKNNMTSCEEERDYKHEGVKASTTNNIYGIYDMSGGTWERPMAAIANIDGTFAFSSTGFSKQLDSKYFDLYPNNTASIDFSNGKLGDATKEVRKKEWTNANGWYNDYGYFPYTDYNAWFHRGGVSNSGSASGLFYVSYTAGGILSNGGSRAVLTY